MPSLDTPKLGSNITTKEKKNQPFLNSNIYSCAASQTHNALRLATMAQVKQMQMMRRTYISRQKTTNM
jgi:hypothetical protein